MNKQENQLETLKLLLFKKSPTINEIMKDCRVYQYSIEEKKLKINEEIVWSVE